MFCLTQALQVRAPGIELREVLELRVARLDKTYYSSALSLTGICEQNLCAFSLPLRFYCIRPLLTLTQLATCQTNNTITLG